MKIMIDDTYKSIENDSQGIELFKCNSIYQLSDLLKILLTDSQMYNYIGDDTCRVFTVSENKIQKGKDFMLDNIWNKKA